MKPILFPLLYLFGISAYAFTLLWTPAEDAKGYRVYHTDSITEGWTLLEDIGPRSPVGGYIEYQVPDPKVLTIYQVRAYNEGGEAALEHVFTGWDPTAPTAPPQWSTDTKLGARP